MILRATVVKIEKPSCVISCDSSKTTRKSCDEIAHNTNKAFYIGICAINDKSAIISVNLESKRHMITWSRIKFNRLHGVSF